MDFFKKHTDTVTILAAFAAAMMWMNGKFNDVDNRFAHVEKEMAIIKCEMSIIKCEFEKEMAIIKTVLIIKQIMPNELAKVEKVEE